MDDFVRTSWGSINIIANTPWYCGKCIFVKRNHYCDWKYQIYEPKTIYVSSGKAIAIVSNTKEDCLSEHETFNLDDMCDVLTNSIDKYYNYNYILNHLSREFVKIDNSKVKTMMLWPGDSIYIEEGLRHTFYGVIDTHITEFSAKYYKEHDCKVLDGH